MKKNKVFIFITFILIIMSILYIERYHYYPYKPFYIENKNDNEIQKIMIKGLYSSDLEYHNKAYKGKEYIKSIVDLLNNLDLGKGYQKNIPANLPNPYLIVYIIYSNPPNEYLILTEEHIYYRYKNNKYIRYKHHMKTITNIIDLVSKSK